MRLLSIALAALALAGTAQARTIDRTISCTIGDQSPAAFAFEASVSRGASWTLELKPGEGQPLQLVGAYGSHPGGVTFGKQGCRAAARAPLDRAGLPQYAFVDASVGQISESCLAAARIAIRVHAVLDKRGSALSGRMAVLSGAALHPIVYVTWTAKRVTLYARSACSY